MPNETNQNKGQQNAAETDTVYLPESTDTSGNVNAKRAIGIILCVCSVVFTIAPPIKCFRNWTANPHT